MSARGGRGGLALLGTPPTLLCHRRVPPSPYTTLIFLYKQTHKALPMNEKARPSFMKITRDKLWGILTLEISPHRLSALMQSRLGARAEWVLAGQLQTSFPPLAQIWGTS